LNELTTLDKDTLSHLNLHNDGDRWNIVWPDDSNIFHMTVGKHLDTDTRHRTATIFERADVCRSGHGVHQSGIGAAQYGIPPR